MKLNPKPVGEVRTYNAIDFLALSFLLDDRKLHAACDQAENGYFLKDVWEKDTKVNCHKLWDELPADQKAFYRKAARAHIFEDSEISAIPKEQWEKF